MKRNRIIAIFLFCIVLMSSCCLHAQNYLIEKYYLTATDREYGIYANVNCNSKDELFFDLDAPNDQQLVQAQLSFNKYSDCEMEIFIRSLELAKQKFREWSFIAKDNNLTLFSKTIPILLTDKKLFFTNEGKWFYENGVDMKYIFFVDSHGNSYLIIESDYMTSEEMVASTSSFSFSGAYNSYLGSLGLGVGFSKGNISIERYCGGASLTFSTIAEIDEFIRKLRNVARFRQNIVEKGKLLK